MTLVIFTTKGIKHYINNVLIIINDWRKLLTL